MPQLLHEPTQLTGHDAVLHVCDCVPPFETPYTVVQDTPPFDAAVDCVNVLDWLPVPQVTGQLSQLLHEPMQLMGHDAVLQFCDCVPAFSAP